LFGLVFEDPEIFFLEAVNEFAAIIEDGGMQNDQVDVDLDGAALLVGALVGGRRGGLGKSKGVVLSEGRDD
jgi:hypothetical protein